MTSIVLSPAMKKAFGRGSTQFACDQIGRGGHISPARVQAIQECNPDWRGNDVFYAYTVAAEEGKKRKQGRPKVLKFELGILLACVHYRWVGRFVRYTRFRSGISDWLIKDDVRKFIGEIDHLGLTNRMLTLEILRARFKLPIACDTLYREILRGEFHIR